jgi:YHS domain-containing protein
MPFWQNKKQTNAETMFMKNRIILAALLGLLSLTILAEDNQTTKPKPYPLATCLVCGMTLGDMGKPFMFEYNGQEIKVCDKSEKSAFDKDPDKFIKKLAEAVAKLKQ